MGRNRPDFNGIVDPASTGPSAGGMSDLRVRLRRLERTARDRAPRPWVLLLALGLGLFGITLIHSRLAAARAPSTAGRQSAPAGERTTSFDLRALDLAPPSRTIHAPTPSRTQGHPEVLSAALPPDPASLVGSDRGLFLPPVPGADPNLRHRAASLARAPPPPFPV